MSVFAGPFSSAQYQRRMVCFIDLLGFKSAIERSVVDRKVLSNLFEMLRALKVSDLRSAIYGGVPTLVSDRQLVTAEEAGTVAQAEAAWPLCITQFSDSFVISCAAENIGSCRLFLQTIYAVVRLFFGQLEILMRGGICIGQLIHEEGGPLFGPAMNEAYRLESSQAVYPRVLIDADAATHLRNVLDDKEPLLRPFFDCFDGHTAFDVVSLTRLASGSDAWGTLKARLAAMADDIEAREPKALPKVRYLQDRLETEWPRSEFT